MFKDKLLNNLGTIPKSSYPFDDKDIVVRSSADELDPEDLVTIIMGCRDPLACKRCEDRHMAMAKEMGIPDSVMCIILLNCRMGRDRYRASAGKVVSCPIHGMVMDVGREYKHKRK